MEMRYDLPPHEPKMTLFLLKRLIWVPFKLYVLAQHLPGLSLKSQGQWAVVTGATDGIGKAYARALASKGLDIILISRSDEKLEKVKQQISNEFKCAVKTIQADFSRTDIYDKIRNELEGVDIGVLVNNVGVTHKLTSVLDFPNIATVSEELININCTSVMRMTSLVLPRMAKKGKGVVVNIASCLALGPMENISVYSATKSFVYNFSKAIGIDCKAVPGITIQTLTPGITVTNLFSDMVTDGDERKKLDLLTVTPERLVSYAINTIGWSDSCDGHPLHWFFNRLFTISDYF